MNQNHNCVPTHFESATNATTWQQGMAGAALARNLTVQWCYATPTDVLASLEMPAVTNFRVSFDFCYGRSWDIGTSSLLVWALGAFPSKDTLWTSDNGRLAVPGCNWTPDHEAPATALHAVLAVMSMGPVGISDGFGQTDGTLLKRIISADGTLLKPSKSLTAVDSAIAGTAGAPSGNVYATYTSSPSMLTSYTFVSFKLKSAFSVREPDFFPSLAGRVSTWAIRAFSAAAACKNGTAAAACGITVATAAQVRSGAAVKLPASDFSNVTGGTDFAPTVASVYPFCASGKAFLGDLSKYVSASFNRFPSVSCTATGVHVELVGVPGEKVAVTALRQSSGGAFVVADVVVVGNDGRGEVVF